MDDVGAHQSLMGRGPYRARAAPRPWWEEPRGCNGREGRHIKLEDAAAQFPGVAGLLKGQSFEGSPEPFKGGRWVWQYTATADRPGGDLYDGGWAWCDKLHTHVERGRGLMVNTDPDHRGLVHEGKYRNGQCHGPGKSWWVDSSVAWHRNELPGGANGAKPFRFEGEYRKDEKVSGIRTFKDGRQEQLRRDGTWLALPPASAPEQPETAAAPAAGAGAGAAAGVAAAAPAAAQARAGARGRRGGATPSRRRGSDRTTTLTNDRPPKVQRKVPATEAAEAMPGATALASLHVAAPTAPTGAAAQTMAVAFAPPAVSIPDQMERLYALKLRGALTQRQYDRAVEKVLE